VTISSSRRASRRRNAISLPSMIAMSYSSLNLERDLTLLMTAAIFPVPGMHRFGLTRTDPAQREQDYIDAVTYYLTNHPRIRRIAFVENSAAPLGKIQRAAESNNPYGKDIEFVSLDCNKHPPDFGGGYGEWELMSRGMETSRLLSTAPYFAKMTGRQWILNATRIVEGAKAPLDFLGDTKDTSLYRRLGLCEVGRTRMIDARFWVTSVDFYRNHIRDLHRAHRQGIFFAEPALYNAITAAAAADHNLRIVWRFPVEPRIRGIAGSMNKNYGSLRQKLKRSIRGTARRVAPGIWL
jgi:hypothetical protein